MPETLDYRGPSPNPPPPRVPGEWPGALRVALFVGGIVLPAAEVAIALAGGRVWRGVQAASDFAILSSLPDSGGLDGFAVLHVWSWAAVAALVAKPEANARRPWVRLGLASGLVLAAQGVVIFASALFGPRSVDVGITCLLAQLGLAAVVAWAVWANLAWVDHRPPGPVVPPRPVTAEPIRPRVAESPRPIGPVAVTVLAVAGCVPALLLAATVIHPAAQVVALCGLLIGVFQPMVSAATFLLALLATSTLRGLPHRITGPGWRVTAVVALAWIVGYGLAWRRGLRLAREHYAGLPRFNDCYVATAAARGPAWLTGGFPGRQLLRLKAAELVLAERHPAAHRRLRRIYNRIGPGLARRLCHPAAAAGAFLALKPAEWFVAGLGYATTRAAGRGARRRRKWLGRPGRVRRRGRGGAGS